MFAEKCVAEITQQCCYASQGCEQVSLRGSIMKPHEDNCMFRPVKCFMGNCGWPIPYKGYLAHVTCAHKVEGTDTLPAQVVFKYNPIKAKGSPKWLPFYIAAFGGYFYVMMQRIGKSYWVWVYSQVSKECDEVEYTYHAHIKLKHPDKKVSLSWHGPVYSIRTSFKSIQEEGCALSLPGHIIKTFCSKPKECLTFSVDIRKHPRRSLKGIKVNGGTGDSDVAMEANGNNKQETPSEYDNPPSYFDPNGNTTPDSTQSQDNNNPRETGGGPQDDSIQPTSSTMPNTSKSCTEMRKFKYPQLNVEKELNEIKTFPKRLRRAAIGIPSFPNTVVPTAPLPLIGKSISQASTATSFLDNTQPPAELNITSNDEGGDGDDDIFGDKIPLSGKLTETIKNKM